MANCVVPVESVHPQRVSAVVMLAVGMRALWFSILPVRPTMHSIRTPVMLNDHEEFADVKAFVAFSEPMVSAFTYLNVAVPEHEIDEQLIGPQYSEPSFSSFWFLPSHIAPGDKNVRLDAPVNGFPFTSTSPFDSLIYPLSDVI